MSTSLEVFDNAEEKVYMATGIILLKKLTSMIIKKYCKVCICLKTITQNSTVKCYLVTAFFLY